MPLCSLASKKPCRGVSCMYSCGLCRQIMGFFMSLAKLYSFETACFADSEKLKSLDYWEFRLRSPGIVSLPRCGLKPILLSLHPKP